MVLEGQVHSPTAAGANISTKEKGTRWRVKFRALQSSTHNPPAGTWWKIPLHHHDNLCYIIVIATGWTSLVFNHMHSGQHANRQEPPPRLGAGLCPAAGPIPTYLCSLSQPSSLFPSATLLAKLPTTAGSPNPNPCHHQRADFMHFTVASAPPPHCQVTYQAKINASRKFSSSQWVIENLFY